MSNQALVQAAGIGIVRHRIWTPEAKLWTPWRTTWNKLTAQGLAHLLEIGLTSSGTRDSTWFNYLMLNNSTPLTTWTAQNHVTNGGEFTNYTSATRVAWVPNAATTITDGGEVDNTGAETEFTMDTGGGTFYGAGLVSNNTKGSDAGAGEILIGVTNFGIQTLTVGSKVQIGYGVQLVAS